MSPLVENVIKTVSARPHGPQIKYPHRAINRINTVLIYRDRQNLDNDNLDLCSRSQNKMELFNLRF